ncbi:MAG TPA: hypothetical protein PLP31_00875 [Thermoanaerobaculaceae bacterium]|nr:hypothetical protein [Thermoanaerobaculaceae bacterium]
MEQAWDRQPQESGKAYGAFLVFRDLGPARTVEEAARRAYPPGGPERGREGAKEEPRGKRARGRLGHVTLWARQWNWQTRALAWDAHQQRIALGAAEERARQHGRELADKLREHEERALALASQVMDKVEEMLAFPVAVESTEVDADGNTVKVIRPARWSFRDVAILLEKADALIRLALGAETSRTAVKVEEGRAAQDDLLKLLSDPEACAAMELIDNRLHGGDETN